MSRWRRWSGWRVAWLGLAGLVVAGALVALVDAGGGGNDDSGPVDAATSSAGAVDGDAALREGASAADAEVVAEAEAEAEAPADEAAGGGGAGADTVGTLAALGVGGPRVVKTADLRVEVAEEGFADAFDRAGEVARANGGFVVSSSTSSFEAGRASGDLTLRVPSETFDAARRALAGLGELESEQVGGEDVGAQLVDLAARLRSLRAEEEALNTLLARAGNVGEVLSVRDRITGVRTSIEQLAAQEQGLSDAVTFSTLTVALFEPAAAPAPEAEPRPQDTGTELADRLGTAVDVAVAVLGGMLVVVGFLAPFAALALLAWLGTRLVQSRRRPVPAA